MDRCGRFAADDFQVRQAPSAHDGATNLAREAHAGQLAACKGQVIHHMHAASMRCPGAALIAPPRGP